MSASPVEEEPGVFIFSHVNVVCRHSVQQGTDGSQMSEGVFSFSNAKEAKVDTPHSHKRPEVQPQRATLQLHSSGRKSRGERGGE